MDWQNALSGGLQGLANQNPGSALGIGSGALAGLMRRRRIGLGNTTPPNTAPMTPQGGIAMPGADNDEDDQGIPGMADGGAAGTMYGSWADSPMGQAAAGMVPTATGGYTYQGGPTGGPTQSSYAPVVAASSPMPDRASAQAVGQPMSGALYGPRNNRAPLQGPPADNRPLPPAAARYNTVQNVGRSYVQQPGGFPSMRAGMAPPAPQTAAPAAPQATQQPRQNFGSAHALAKGGIVEGLAGLEPKNQETSMRRYSPIGALPPSVSLQPKPEDMAHRLPHRMAITPRLKVRMPHPSMGTSGHVSMGR